MTKKLKTLIVLPLIILANYATAEWNGMGQIKQMYIYPDYALIVQGNSWAGSAGCANDEAWTIVWSEFDQATQNRVHSILLSAHASKTPIMVGLNTTECGPEGKKKFNGQITL